MSRIFFTVCLGFNPLLFLFFLQEERSEPSLRVFLVRISFCSLVFCMVGFVKMYFFLFVLTLSRDALEALFVCLFSRNQLD